MKVDLDSARPPLRARPLLRWAWQLAKDVLKEFQEDGIGDVAASITFWTILSIPASVLALVSASSSLERFAGASVANKVETEIQQYITDTFTNPETLNQTVAELFNTSSAGVATVATLFAFFTLSRAFAGLIRALDIAYEVEEGRPWWLLRLVAIGLGVGTVVVVASGATALATLPFHSLLRLLTAPSVFLVLVVWAATVFHFGPNHQTPWRYDLPGAIVTTIGWIVASQGFAVYVRVSGQGNQVQSGIGAILLALTLMYLLSVVLLVGAEVNDVLARRAGVVSEPRSVSERAQSLRDRIVDDR